MYEFFCRDAHTLYHCVGGDPWVFWPLVILSTTNLVAYVLVARYWYKMEQKIENLSPAASDTLRHLRWIFLVCGVGCYGFALLKIWFPAWGLYLVTLFMLNVLSWRFVLISDLNKELLQDIRNAEKARRCALDTYDESPTERVHRLSTELDKVTRLK